ncbi:MAG: maleylacetoacetate isomerase [Beijerinckiaceae bacterium]
MSETYRLLGAQRSSASYRVRIALHLKGIDFAEIFVDLAGGAQAQAAYLAINAQGLVPTLICPDGTHLSQSLAIIDYLEEIHREPALLPDDAKGRARVRSLAQIVACDMHPVNNMRVRNHVRNLLPHDAHAVSGWMAKWSAAGFAALESRLEEEPETGHFCHGDTPGLADICLVPQVYNAQVTGFDMSSYPRVCAIAAACDTIVAFRNAHPDAIG